MSTLPSVTRTMHLFSVFYHDPSLWLIIQNSSLMSVGVICLTFLYRCPSAQIRYFYSLQIQDICQISNLLHLNINQPKQTRQGHFRQTFSNNNGKSLNTLYFIKSQSLSREYYPLADFT